MAQTITTKAPENMVRMATGRYLDTGTVAAYTFSDLGFKPRYVRVWNEAGTGGTMEWVEGMTAANGVKRLAADGVQSLVTEKGITVSSRGFIFGLDTDINVTSEQVSFVALG